MEFSTSAKWRVYCACKTAFSKNNHYNLRRQKAIRRVVDEFWISVPGLSQERLVAILQSLLQDGAFTPWSNPSKIFPGYLNNSSTEHTESTVSRSRAEIDSSGANMNGNDELHKELTSSLYKYDQ